jgi:hypothetical protein
MSCLKQLPFSIYTLRYIQFLMIQCPKCGAFFKIEYTCKRCSHKWTPRNPEKKPEVCPNPKCKSPYWDKPRQKKNQEICKFTV